MTFDLEARGLIRLKTRVELARNLMESAQELVQSSLDQLKVAQEHLEQTRQDRQQANQAYVEVREQSRKALDVKRQELTKVRAAQDKADRGLLTLAPSMNLSGNSEVKKNYNHFAKELSARKTEGQAINQEMGQIRQQTRAAERIFNLAEGDYRSSKQDLAHADNVFQATQKLASRAKADYDKLYSQLQDHLDDQ